MNVRKGSSNKMIFFFPNEVVAQILRNLPPNSVLRLKLVCKQWKLLIESRYFVEYYHKHPEDEETTNNRLFCLTKSNDIYEIDLEKLDFRSFDGMRFPETAMHKCLSPKHMFGSTSRNFDLIGSCNGVHCIKDKQGNVYLYNPSTEAHQRIPNPPFYTQCVKNPWKRSPCRVYGFGYDYRTYDYKLVWITWFYPRQVEVYSFKTNSWKTLGFCPYNKSCLSVINPPWLGGNHGVYVSNSLHWLGEEGRIVCFDLFSEKFTMFPYFDKLETTFTFLDVLNGCLSACCTNGGSTNIDIWVMEKYGLHGSWTKLLTVDAVDASALDIKLITLSKDGCALLLAKLNRWSFNNCTSICWYDIHTSKMMCEVKMEIRTEVNRLATSSQNKLTLTLQKLNKEKKT